MVRENSTYYILGFNSGYEKRDGRYVRLEVRVNRPGLTVKSRDGYVAPVTAFNAPIKAAALSVEDQVAQFRVAKAFMNETVVDSLGIRAFLFTLKLEKCATATDSRHCCPVTAMRC